jgi:hypothetical protein
VAKKILKIVEVSDERKEYYLNDHLIMSANHDDHGWAGMEDIDRIARAMAEGCGASIVESYAEQEEETEDRFDAIRTLLISYVPTASPTTLDDGARLLDEDDVRVATITAHVDLAVELCSKHNITYDYQLLVSNIIGEFIGVTLQIVAATSMDMTYQLNHELGQLEEAQGIVRHIPIFDVVFSRKH